MSGRGSTGTGVAAGAAGGSAARRACVSRAARARDWRSTSAQRDAAVASWTIASGDRKSTRLNSKSLTDISYAVFCLKKKKNNRKELMFVLDRAGIGQEHDYCVQ